MSNINENITLLNEETVNSLKELFNSLVKNVKIVVLVSKDEKVASDMLVKFVDELSNTSDKLEYSVLEFENNKKAANMYQVKTAPAIVLLVDDVFKGYVFYGIPFGREFQSFVNTILMFSNDEFVKTENKELLERLNKLDKEVFVKIYVTANCPYCGPYVEDVVKLILLSDSIYLSVVMADQYVEDAKSRGIQSVPFTVINETKTLVGRIPVDKLLNEIELVLD